MAYFWFKAFHIVGVVVWFAGLFYLVRLFVYHAEAEEKPEPARTILRDQYALMEARLWSFICRPGAAVTIVMGFAMVVVAPALLHNRWLQVKLALVAVLFAYHIACGVWRARLAAGTLAWPAARFRLLNEAPTLLLVAIVLLAVFKDGLPTGAATWAIVALAAGLLIGIQLYARYRRRRAASVSPPVG